MTESELISTYKFIKEKADKRNDMKYENLIENEKGVKLSNFAINYEDQGKKESHKKAYSIASEIPNIPILHKEKINAENEVFFYLDLQ